MIASFLILSHEGSTAMTIIIPALALMGLVLLAFLPRLRRPAQPIELGLESRRRL